jgi:hypothetical protein
MEDRKIDLEEAEELQEAKAAVPKSTMEEISVSIYKVQYVLKYIAENIIAHSDDYGFNGSEFERLQLKNVHAVAYNLQNPSSELQRLYEITGKYY